MYMYFIHTDIIIISHLTSASLSIKIIIIIIIILFIICTSTVRQHLVALGMQAKIEINNQ